MFYNYLPSMRMLNTGNFYLPPNKQPSSAVDYGMSFSVNDFLKPHYLVINTDFMKLTSDQEIVKYLFENKITHVDIRLLKNEANGAYLERINRILTQNFPLVETLRFVPWNDLININISGVKNINDIAGKKFCDIVVGHFKSLCRENVEKYGNKDHKTRVVKDDYRNIAFVWKFEDVKKTIFWKWENKDDIINTLLKNLSTEIKKRAQEIVDEQKRTWEIIIQNTEEYNQYIQEKLQSIIETIKNHFNFWASQVNIPQHCDDIERLEILRKSEIASRKWIYNEEKILIHSYDEDSIFSLLEKAWEIETSLIENYSGKSFIFDDTLYNIIFYSNGEAKISTELLRYVRKYPNRVYPSELTREVQWYIQSLNLALDYITPINGEVAFSRIDFEMVTAINKEISSWIIMTDYFFKSYKWGYTKDAFASATRNKPGIRVSIDIKDMWIDNIFDFNKMSKKILTLKSRFESNEFSQSDYKQRLSDLFLSAGETVTNQIREVQMRIKEKYPNGIIRFWGDEIEIFLPESSQENIWEIENHIQQTLSASWQKARVIIDNTLWKDDAEFAFSQLDRMWKINKMVEEVLEQKIQKEDFIWVVPNCTYLKMDNFSKDTIFRKWFPLNDFIKKIRELLIKNHLEWDEKWENCIWDCGHNIQLTLKQKNVFEVEIYLHN